MSEQARRSAVNPLRLLLFVLYLFVSFLLFVFFGAGGHGSFGPAITFGSWALLPLYSPVVAPAVAVTLPAYWWALSRLNGRGATSSNRSVMLVGPLIHAAGVLTVGVSTEQGVSATPGLVAVSYVAGGLSTCVYFVVDMWLARNALPFRPDDNGNPAVNRITSR